MGALPTDSTQKRTYARAGIFWATITLSVVYGLVALAMGVFQAVEPGEYDTFVYTAVSGMSVLVASMLFWVYTYDTSVANPPFDMTCPDGYTATGKDGDLVCEGDQQGLLFPVDENDKTMDPLPPMADENVAKGMKCNSLNMSSLRNLQTAMNMENGGRTPNWARCTARKNCKFSWSAIGGGC